jgi:hypothetical protein
MDSEHESKNVIYRERYTVGFPPISAGPVIRMCPEDFAQLGLAFDHIVEVTDVSTARGGKCYARARYVYDNEWAELMEGKVQIDYLSLLNLGSPPGAKLAIRKLDHREVGLARRIILKPEIPTAFRSLDKSKFLAHLHPKLLLMSIDGSPAWKGGPAESGASVV